ncbi:MAG TPA: hypothetical protein VHQ92_01135 [Pseudolabrys sp.]|nr:hypothetical protein [Pseudolabrys sp.]
MSFVSLVFGAAGGGIARQRSQPQESHALPPQTMIAALTLDALINESTELNSEASKYAIEDGADVTDNIVREHERLSISGWITGAQINAYGTGGRSKLISAKDSLRKIHSDRAPITVVTGLDTYPNMVMTSCKINRDAEKGDVYDISADFEQIEKVTLRSVDIPPAKVRPGKPAQKAGATNTKAGKTAGKPETTMQSDLKAIKGRISSRASGNTGGATGSF